MKRLAILGSTGSIGVNALDVLSRLKGRFKVVALSAEQNSNLLIDQARRFRPEMVSIGRDYLARDLKKKIPRGTKVFCGPEGLNRIAASSGVDMVLFAISGNACLAPLVEAIKHKKAVALANKEALVSAGPIVMKLAASRGVAILPVDSEHSAVFQCVNGRPGTLSKIYLTGSGGPLLDVNADRFDTVGADFILKHPKWSMGRKISVDSATMMNKGLEVIEASYLFGLDEKRIEVLVHPEAIIHSMVEFSDGAVLAQLAVPDMRIPIQFALTYPDRFVSPVKSIDFGKLSGFTFRKPDLKKFPCLELARCAARAGGTAPAVLCAADEEAVKRYLEGRVKFSKIPKIVERVLRRHRNTKDAISVRDVTDADAWAREEARSICCH